MFHVALKIIIKHFPDLEHLNSHGTVFFSSEVVDDTLSENFFNVESEAKVDDDSLPAPATRSSKRLEDRKLQKCDSCGKTFRSKVFFARHVESCADRVDDDVDADVDDGGDVETPAMTPNSGVRKGEILFPT